jgi:hypothetical protein
MRQALVGLILFLLQASALAFPAPVQVKPGKIASPMSGGVVIGGQARDEFSLIGASSENSFSGKGERLILLYGDRFGAPLKGDPGYFHVALDRDSKRVVIDLAQIRKTAVEPLKLAKLLSVSKLIATSEMTMDPYDGSTNITLNLRTPVRLSASSDGSAQSKVVIELQPLLSER